MAMEAKEEKGKRGEMGEEEIDVKTVPGPSSKDQQVHEPNQKRGPAPSDTVKPTIAARQGSGTIRGFVSQIQDIPRAFGSLTNVIRSHSLARNGRNEQHTFRLQREEVSHAFEA